MSYLIKLICLPGYMVVFLNYFFPKGGIVGVAESGRQYREKDVFAFYYSVLFYIIVGVIFYVE